MAYVHKIYDENFLYYASYVITDRAIPELDDGLKPVQRRILHTLFELDDGKYHKVANVVGQVMKYHPHGDASIYSALVVLANKDLFIDKQGNFGNLLTGDEASAARYIECRINQFAKSVFYNPHITTYIDSYDGRNKEPLVFPAKLPVVLMIGAEGIAVGMSTKILPHNPLEVIQAEIAALKGKPFTLYPDFPGGGLIDVSEYDDGLGKIRVRAVIDDSDPKRIVIKELPFGVTTESLIESIENAGKKGRIKIASINDFTTDKVEIEIKLARGEQTSKEVIDALYAFTECEETINCNLLVIKDGSPQIMKVSEIIQYHAKKLVQILKAELTYELEELEKEYFRRTLERIFIEERIYKEIENKKTQETVLKAVYTGLMKFKDEIGKPVTEDDIEFLLKTPIRKISLYDIEKARHEMEAIIKKIKEIKHNLKHITDYAVSVLETMASMLDESFKRKTKIVSFEKIAVREAARRNLALRYDAQTGYLGTAVSAGEQIETVSPFDKVLIIRNNGIVSVIPVPEKTFVDKHMLFCSIAEKELIAPIVFSCVYKDKEGYPYIKRFTISGWIMNKHYEIIPEDAEILLFTTEQSGYIHITYTPKPRLKITEEYFDIQEYPVRALKAKGLRLAPREAQSGELMHDIPQGKTVTSYREEEKEPEKLSKNGLLAKATQKKNAAKLAQKKEKKADAKKSTASAKKITSATKKQEKKTKAKEKLIVPSELSRNTKSITRIGSKKVSKKDNSKKTVKKQK